MVLAYHELAGVGAMANDPHTDNHADWDLVLHSCVERPVHDGVRILVNESHHRIGGIVSSSTATAKIRVNNNACSVALEYGLVRPKTYQVEIIT